MAPWSGRYRSASRVSEIDVWDTMQNHQLQGDSSSSDEGLHPRSRQTSSKTRGRSGHSRSQSHPFPSLFSGRKKKTGPGSSPNPMADLDDSSESGSAMEGGIAGAAGAGASKGSGPAPASRGHRNGSSAGSRDFATGRCMTCASLVRWPRELQMFRCTICLTVNDLQPRSREAGPGESPGAQEVGEVIEEQASSKDTDKAISLSYTKSLIEQCLRSFLTSALKNPEGVTTPLNESPPKSSFLSPDHITIRVPTPPAPGGTTTLRPKASLNFEPRLSPGPPRHLGAHRRAPSWAGTPSSKAYSTSSEKRSPLHQDLSPHGAGGQNRPPSAPCPNNGAKRIFRPLEDYIIRCFTSFECLNSSFLTPRSQPPAHNSSPVPKPRRPSEHALARRETRSTNHPVPELDPKLLLLGDFAENGLWWTGHDKGRSIVSLRSPHIDWSGVEDWYKAVVDAARSWPDVYEKLVAEDASLAASPATFQRLEAQIHIGQEHAQKALLKASETILKRPGRRLTDPQELRFLLIVAENPLLHASYRPYGDKYTPVATMTAPPRGTGPVSGRHSVIIKRIVGLLSNTPAECHHHLVVWFARYSKDAFVQIKDLVSGFLAYRLIRQSEKKQETQIDYMGGLIPNLGPSHSPAALHAALGPSSSSSNPSQRAKKQQEKKKKVVYQEDWQIKAAAQVLAFLFAANNASHVRRGGTMTDHHHGDGPNNTINNSNNQDRELVQAPGQILPTSDFYMTLLDDSDLLGDFEASERRQGRFSFCQHPFLLSIGAKIQILEHDARRQMENKARDAFFDSIMTNRVVQQFLVLNIRRECLVEDSLKAVSEVIGGGGEEIKKGLRIIFKGEEGVDAGGLRKEWFLLLVREVFNPDHGMFLYDEDSNYCYFNPNSLEPSEQFFLVGVVLGLAIYNSTILDVALPPFAFRKLLAAAPLSSATHSHSPSSFSPPSLTTPNGTITATPGSYTPNSYFPTTAITTNNTTAAISPATATPPVFSQPRQPMAYTLDDLAEYRPRLARGLRQLLEYEGDDVEAVFGLDFAVDTVRYGAPVERVPLCPGGERRAVTNANRKEYVDAYVRYMLDTSVTRQFEPFKRGFYTVCGSGSSINGAGGVAGGSGSGASTVPFAVGNGGGSSGSASSGSNHSTSALSLFRPEEIEILVRGSAGSDQRPLDIDALRAAAHYEGWSTSSSHQSQNQKPKTKTNEQQEQEEPTLQFFWSAFASAPPARQRRLLAFITGSDRVPALGAASLAIRVSCLGEECGRFPTARTCFNSVGLWRVRVNTGISGLGLDGVGEGEGETEMEREKERFTDVLWRAVEESEGFGLK
ncbi:uncharacterized protein C8A04DRAFT_40818 [Dichotomopilus funicola]|uniref:HECT-type E3 ubiquitin transferase n=1 Tax=Dichotomopilus funicola TaxID=1934379 RepID=A0AAN6ZIQ4_9PEZI|nr:hypothetical protein C8A04DRAFT_40818 [Dichotomopilus funicola]